MSEKGNKTAVVCLKKFEEGMEVRVEGTQMDIMNLLIHAMLKQDMLYEMMTGAVEIAAQERDNVNLN